MPRRALFFFSFWHTENASFPDLAQTFPDMAQLFLRLALPLQQNTNRMETSIILTVALAAALIVVVLVLVGIIIYQRWRLGDKNAAISKFIHENEEQRERMKRAGII